MNIYHYYEARLGQRPKDLSLQELPVNSPCGLECAQIIALACCMKAVVDPLCHADLHRLAQHAISIKWRG